MSRSSRPAERPPIRSTSNSVTLAAAAALLGPVHGDVGIVQEVVAGRCPPSLSAMPMLMVATTSWPPLSMIGSRSASSTRSATWPASSGERHALQDDHELVTAEARQRVAGPDGTAEALGDDAQQLVPHLVAEVVVDRP